MRGEGPWDPKRRGRGGAGEGGGVGRAGGRESGGRWRAGVGGRQRWSEGRDERVWRGARGTTGGKPLWLRRRKGRIGGGFPPYFKFFFFKI